MYLPPYALSNPSAPSYLSRLLVALPNNESTQRAVQVLKAYENVLAAAVSLGPHRAGPPRLSETAARALGWALEDEVEAALAEGFGLSSSSGESSGEEEEEQEGEADESVGSDAASSAGTGPPKKQGNRQPTMGAEYEIEHQRLVEEWYELVPEWVRSCVLTTHATSLILRSLAPYAVSSAAASAVEAPYGLLLCLFEVAVAQHFHTPLLSSALYPAWPTPTASKPSFSSSSSAAAAAPSLLPLLRSTPSPHSLLTDSLLPLLLSSSFADRLFYSPFLSLASAPASSLKPGDAPLVAALFELLADVGGRMLGAILCSAADGEDGEDDTDDGERKLAEEVLSRLAVQVRAALGVLVPAALQPLHPQEGSSAREHLADVAAALRGVLDAATPLATAPFAVDGEEDGDKGPAEELCAAQAVAELACALSDSEVAPSPPPAGTRARIAFVLSPELLTSLLRRVFLPFLTAEHISRALICAADALAFPAPDLYSDSGALVAHEALLAALLEPSRGWGAARMGDWEREEAERLRRGIRERQSEVKEEAAAEVKQRRKARRVLVPAPAPAPALVVEARQSLPKMQEDEEEDDLAFDLTSSSSSYSRSRSSSSAPPLVLSEKAKGKKRRAALPAAAAPRPSERLRPSSAGPVSVPAALPPSTASSSSRPAKHPRPSADRIPPAPREVLILSSSPSRSPSPPPLEHSSPHLKEWPRLPPFGSDRRAVPRSDGADKADGEVDGDELDLLGSFRSPKRRRWSSATFGTMVADNVDADDAPAAKRRRPSPAASGDSRASSFRPSPSISRSASPVAGPGTSREPQPSNGKTRRQRGSPSALSTHSSSASSASSFRPSHSPSLSAASVSLDTSLSAPPVSRSHNMREDEDDFDSLAVASSRWRPSPPLQRRQALRAGPRSPESGGEHGEEEGSEDELAL
ncbi:hypothetical protein JCM10213v2_002157 [Rhodosporidiobolus nylandii]